MSEKTPDPHSRRTWERAEDLAFGRGCDVYNDCWSECVEAARDQIVEGDLDEWDRRVIHDERKRRYVH